MDTVTKGKSESLFPPESRSDSERTLLSMAEAELEELKRPRNGSIDVEKEGADGSLLQQPEVIAVTKGHVQTDPYARARMFMWMAINTLATVFITFANKAIFSDPSFNQCQASFASFHFFVTSFTLWIASQQRFAMFTPKWIPVMSMLPLAIAMALNVVSMNFSLQISTITFYQITRVLVTPVVAIINFFFYAKSMPRLAAYALTPMCFGVALISYYDVKPPPVPGDPIKHDGMLGVTMALGSVVISSVYTVWVGTYRSKFDVNGFQLLHNQAPIGAIVLLYVVPWTDKFPALDGTPVNIWWMIGFSGILAALINVSQFYIIVGAGPVESTVVGHLKTCLIVLIGAFSGGRVITVPAAMGILLALMSIFAYSAIMMRQPK